MRINLPYDVATGKRSATEARAFYADAVMKSMKGEKPPYMQSLQFACPRARRMPASLRLSKPYRRSHFHYKDSR